MKSHSSIPPDFPDRFACCHSGSDQGLVTGHFKPDARKLAEASFTRRQFIDPGTGYRTRQYSRLS